MRETATFTRVCTHPRVYLLSYLVLYLEAYVPGVDSSDNRSDGGALVTDNGPLSYE
jgi:hypothetical protein